MKYINLALASLCMIIMVSCSSQNDTPSETAVAGDAGAPNEQTPLTPGESIEDGQPPTGGQQPVLDARIDKVAT